MKLEHRAVQVMPLSFRRQRGPCVEHGSENDAVQYDD